MIARMVVLIRRIVVDRAVRLPRRQVARLRSGRRRESGPFGSRLGPVFDRSGFSESEADQMLTPSPASPPNINRKNGGEACASGRVLRADAVELAAERLPRALALGLGAAIELRRGVGGDVVRGHRHLLAARGRSDLQAAGLLHVDVV